MFDTLHSFAWLSGRILLSVIFLISGVMKIVAFPDVEKGMAAHGMPAVPFFLVCAIIVELLGGLSVLLGYKARLGALVLAAYLIPVTLVMHGFWTAEGAAMQNQFTHFLKNVAIIGGLLVVVGGGAGPASIDALSRHGAEHRHEHLAGVP